MKYLSFLLLLSLLIVGCSETPPRPAPVMTQAQHDAINAESAALEAQKAAQIAAAKASSPSSLHYYCSAHPDKGGSDQGSCPECGLALVHNQAFHNAPATPGSPITSASVPPAPAVSGGSVFHYTCPNGCAGGAAAQADCTVCGTPLAHNQAFHNTPASTETALTPPTVPTTPAASAVNASGVYHYTCSNGCAGGAAAQANCAVCGNPLAHNQAYHN
jgi:hypothetical protein